MYWYNYHQYPSQEDRLLQETPARESPLVHRGEGACEKGKEKVMKLMVKPYLSVQPGGMVTHTTKI